MWCAAPYFRDTLCLGGTPANTRRLPDVDLTLDQRLQRCLSLESTSGELQRCLNLESTSGERLMFWGYSHINWKRMRSAAWSDNGPSSGWYSDWPRFKAPDWSRSRSPPLMGLRSRLHRLRMATPVSIWHTLLSLVLHRPFQYHDFPQCYKIAQLLHDGAVNLFRVDNSFVRKLIDKTPPWGVIKLIGYLNSARLGECCHFY